MLLVMEKLMRCASQAGASIPLCRPAATPPCRAWTARRLVHLVRLPLQARRLPAQMAPPPWLQAYFSLTPRQLWKVVQSEASCTILSTLDQVIEQGLPLPAPQGSSAWHSIDIYHSVSERPTLQ